MATFREHVKTHRARLRELPYADQSEPDGDPYETLALALEKHEPLQVIRWESNLSDPFYRVLALDYLVHEHPKGESTTWSATELSEPTFITGDLHVKGNLINRSNLVVLGDLRIEGSYVALGEYPCVSVGGDFSCGSFYANEAETLCLKKIDASDDFVVVYNHTVTIARQLHATTLVSSDASIDAEIASPKYLEDPTDDAVAEHFGIEIDEDDEDYDADEALWDPVIRKILGEA